MVDKAAFDLAFPLCGPCAFCGQQDARHRVIDAIQDRHRAGDTVAELAKDYDVSEEAVRMALDAGETCTCPTECDCQQPPTHLSNECPIHNENPYPAHDCPIHGHARS